MPQAVSGSTVAGAGALPRGDDRHKPPAHSRWQTIRLPPITFTYTAGTVSPGTSTWCFTDGTTNPYTIKGSLTLNNITFLAIDSATFTIPAATTLTTTGDLTIAGTSSITLNTGNINVHGNLYLTNAATGGGGSALITINGTGSQAIDGTAISIGQDLLPLVTINKTVRNPHAKGQYLGERELEVYRRHRSMPRLFLPRLLSAETTSTLPAPG